jgi:alkylation response protein AidB-like acyl-CoA dehydrogenase
MTRAAAELPAGGIAGHPGTGQALSARAAMAGLPALTRQLLRYQPESLWDVDTARLPRRLQAYRRRARDFAQGTLAPRALTVDVLPHLPAGEVHPQVLELVRIAALQGWLTDFTPWPLGSCAWLDFRHPLVLRTCLLVEEFSRACGGLMLLLCANMLGMAPVLLSGQPRLIWRTLRAARRANLRGEPHLFAFAITEPGAGSDAEDGHGAALGKPGVRAARARGGWLLNGEKLFISGGDLARQLTVFAALEGEGFESWTCFLVDSDAPGFERVRTELKMGMRASGAAQLRFKDVFVADRALVGGLRRGWALNRSTLNISRTPVGAMGVGFAQAAVDVAVAHACATRLGGRPLIDFQDVQQALAQMIADTSAARALVWQSASTWRPRQGAASIAKFHCTDTAINVIHQAMDLVGERAVLHRTRLEKIYRDARLTQIFEGTNQINRLSVIEDLQEELLGRIATGART